jgi:hypothetical protein
VLLVLQVMVLLLLLLLLRMQWVPASCICSSCMAFHWRLQLRQQLPGVVEPLAGNAAVASEQQ